MSNKTKEENSVEELQLEAFGTSGAVINAEEFTDELDINSFPKGFFIINKDPKLVFTGHILTDGAYNSYLVATVVAEQLGSDVKLRGLRLAQTVDGNNFVLSTAAPTAQNGRNGWVRSGQEAISQGMDNYIRVTRFDDAFRIIKSQRPYPKTIWPELSLEDMIEQAFGERMITDMEHPLVKVLLGL